MSENIRSVRHLANQIRNGRTDAQTKYQRTAEALDLIDGALQALLASIRQLQTAQTPATTTTTSDIITVVDLTLNTASTFIPSPIPIVDNTILCMRVFQDSTGGRLCAFLAPDFSTTPANIRRTPDSMTLFLFLGISGQWQFLTVVNP